MAAVMLFGTFTACETESLETTFGDNNGKSIKLLLNAQGDDINRAISRSEGNDNYGENTIATADVFFYDANGALLYDVAKGNVTLSEPVNGVVTATVPMPSDNTDLTQAATVYVMGNRQATDAQVNGAKNSEAALRALTFTTDLATVPTAKTTFAMDGTGDITVTDNEISGTVELVRNAAKITLTVNLPSTLIADGKTYKPQTGNITVTFNEGVKTFGVENEVFDVTERKILSQEDIKNDANEVESTTITFAPFYSYPTTWEVGAANEPYFTLHVPWGETNAEGNVTSYTTYHYRVPINKEHFEEDGKTLALNRNHWYQIDLTVGVLGTPEASDYVELTANYEVKPWGNLPIGADLLDYKYLVVDQERVEIYNQNSASVAFASSHPVTLEIISIKKWDYSTEDGTELNYAPSSTATDKSVVAANATPTNGSRKLLTQCNVNAVTGENPNKGNIELNHVLINQDANTNQDVDGNNKNRDDYDYVYYTIIVKVTNGYYTENITFIQYPEMYIEANKNEGGNIVNDGKTSNDDKGYVFVYNNQLYSGSDWQVVRSCKDGRNNNPNMYVITVTALDSNSEYYIGDPRVDTPVSGSSLSLGNSYNNKTLTNYYPTRVDNIAIIAPQFRMASSYGKCGDGISHEDAKKRCAAYQEYGYPAGRWRLPTVAEFEYVQQLSNNGIIPQLYTTNSEYWTATTAYTYGSGPSSTANTAYVRCVYDEWYWGDEQLTNKGIYTWGD